MSATILPQLPPTLLGDATAFVYEIVASDVLPLLDMSRSVRSVVLPQPVARWWDNFITSQKKSILTGYVVSIWLWWIVPFAPAAIGRWISIVLAAPTCLGSVTHFSLLRYEVIILLTKTYEFWFFSISNSVSTVLLALYFSDARALLALNSWIGFQNNILADANISLQREFVRATSMAALFTFAIMVLMTLGMVDDVHDFELVRVDDNRIVRAQDVLSLALSTQVIVMCRNAYRRRAALRQRSFNTAIIDCVTIRTRVKLQLVEHGTQTSRVRIADSSRATSMDGTSLVQMKLQPVTTRFHADHVIVRWVGRLLSHLHPHAIRYSMAGVACLGLFLPIVSAACTTGHRGDHIRWAALTITFLFVLVSSAMYQRQLFRQIILSFDFAFISTQLTVIHWCLAELCNWDFRSLPILTYWLWLQWVLTCDAMTPDIRRKCGIRYRLPAFIMLIFIISQAVIFIVVAVVPDVSLRNRVIVSATVRGQAVEMKVVPVLLSRLLVVFGWSCRIVWRLWTMKEDELLMIQGRVTYVSNRKLEKKERNQMMANPSKP